MMRVLRLVGVFLAARPPGSVSWRIAVSATGSKPLDRWLSPAGGTKGEQLTPPQLLLGPELLAPTPRGGFRLWGPSDNQHSHFPGPHSRLLLWEVLLGPLLSLSTVVVFSVTSTLDGEREGESGGWGRVSEGEVL